MKNILMMIFESSAYIILLPAYINLHLHEQNSLAAAGSRMPADGRGHRPQPSHPSLLYVDRKDHYTVFSGCANPAVELLCYVLRDRKADSVTGFLAVV